jgi:bacteriorhodopsin
MKKWFLFFFLVNWMILGQNLGFSQNRLEYFGNKDIAAQTKNDFLVVMAAGVGGAVLGLSTLSFASEPEDNYGNILTGGAIGIIAGVIYVAYRQAYGPNEFEAPAHEVRTINDRTYGFFNYERPVNKFSPYSINFTTSF